MYCVVYTPLSIYTKNNDSGLTATQESKKKARNLGSLVLSKIQRC